MASKHVSEQVTHELTVGLTTVGHETYVTCAYSNGERVHGPNPHSMPHPELRVSIGDQDALLWTSRFPFAVEVQDAPAGLFFRPQPWISVQGRDQLHRVHSGPLNPSGREFIAKAGLPLKFSIVKLTSTAPPTADSSAQPLDPHFIAEP